MYRSALVVAAVIFGGGCSRDWRTDMWYQPSLRPEDAPRPQPDRSVPLDGELQYQDREETEELRNPVTATAASLAHGKTLFISRCAPCHGVEGHGGGPVSKFFPAAPDLAYVTVRARTDGFIWGTITYGGKAMPSQREGLSERDRWDLVNHVRTIQGRLPRP
ncbi:MAG TPA: cytochrome c [Gemmatimonadales bacterium]|nr:cytochrome c [Gemmatimonadales bacterium]